MNFKQEFKDLVIEKNIDWGVKGLLSSDDRVYPFGSDTKVISTIFELFCAPLVKDIADIHGYKFETSPQTIYPDFTLLKSKDDRKKIAIDVKTTYRRGTKKNGTDKDFVYTLGSYTSFIRNNTKNILYPYDQYEKHWIIGFLYSRNLKAYDDNEIYGLTDRKKIQEPFVDVEYFIQEKYKIAGKRPGSGNTANIASFSTNNIKNLEDGKGPFADQGEEAFLQYWRNYRK